MWEADEQNYHNNYKSFNKHVLNIFYGSDTDVSFKYNDK